MADRTKIEWTEATWNPVTGCSKVSAGCGNCYAERLALRLQAMGVPRYRNGFSVTLHPDLLVWPKRLRKSRIVLVNSMSDLFHEHVPTAFIRRVFETMRACPQHVFQVLTKRSGRLRELARNLDWPANVWMGVTVEDGSALYRIADLQTVPAKVRFLSCEPLLGPLDALPLEGIHWVIVGGESGPSARRMRPEWVHSILGQCRRAGIPFFFKQWGGARKPAPKAEINGRSYREMPGNHSAARRQPNTTNR